MKYAAPAEVDLFASRLQDEYLICRDTGHVWDHWTAQRHGRGFVRSLKCDRCETSKEQNLDSRGRILSSKYRYPDSYVVKGLGRIIGTGRDTIRLESLTRAVDR